MRKILSLLGLVALSACVEPINVQPTVPFNFQEVAYINQRGAAAIEGQAFMRQQGGGVVTCAGEEVRLIPAGSYGTQRLQAIYGTGDRGFISLYTPTQADVTSAEYQAWWAASRVTSCDAQGNFRIDGVANGNYFLLTGVRWMAGDIAQGGFLMHRVNISGGQSQRILLSQ